MNPFDQNVNQGNFQQHQNQNDPIIMNPGGQWGDFYPVGKPSWLERLVGKGAGVLKKVSILILAAAGLAVVIALFIPFLKFLSEFSSWLYDLVDGIFY